VRSTRTDEITRLRKQESVGSVSKICEISTSKSDNKPKKTKPIEENEGYFELILS